MPESQPHDAGLLTALDVVGDDALEFLQGQLSQDLRTVHDRALAGSAWINASGRVIVMLDIVAIPGGYRLFVPPAMLDTVRERLLRFRFRSKVELTPRPSAAAWATTQASASRGCVERALPGRLGIVEKFPAAPDADAKADAGQRATAALWLAARLRAGIPWIDETGTERYTAHQPGLDRLGAISLTKGCYSGQEIVARTHHLGRPKRRIRLLEAYGAPAAPRAGQEVLLDGGKLGSVVSAAPPQPDGTVAVLALLPVGPLPAGMTLDDGLAVAALRLPYEGGGDDDPGGARAP